MSRLSGSSTRWDVQVVGLGYWPSVRYDPYMQSVVRTSRLFVDEHQFKLGVSL